MRPIFARLFFGKDMNIAFFRKDICMDVLKAKPLIYIQNLVQMVKAGDTQNKFIHIYIHIYKNYSFNIITFNCE